MLGLQRLLWDPRYHSRELIVAIYIDLHFQSRDRRGRVKVACIKDYLQVLLNLRCKFLNTVFFLISVYRDNVKQQKTVKTFCF